MDSSHSIENYQTSKQSEISSVKYPIDRNVEESKIKY